LGLQFSCNFVVINASEGSPFRQNFHLHLEHWLVNIIPTSRREDINVHEISKIYFNCSFKYKDMYVRLYNDILPLYIFVTMNQFTCVNYLKFPYFIYHVHLKFVVRCFWDRKLILEISENNLENSHI
jgi:hypothetical protein